MRLPHPLLLRLSAAAPWAGWLLLLGVLALSVVYEQTALSDEVWCLFRRETGWSCPGCGLTRAFCAMSRGEVGDAFRVHLAGPMLYLTAAYAALWGAARLAVGPEMPSLWARWPRVARTWWGVMLLLYCANMVKVTVHNFATEPRWSTVGSASP